LAGRSWDRSGLVDATSLVARRASSLRFDYG
jgi:hypothetical protein